MSINVPKLVTKPATLLSALGSVQAGLIATALFAFLHPVLTTQKLGDSALAIHKSIVAHIHISPLDETPVISGMDVRDAATINVVSEVITDFGHNDEAARELAHAIVTESRGAALDPLLVAAVVKYESSFRTKAVSHRGARGLMQVMPLTEKALLKKVQIDDLALHEKQLRLGSQYLAEMKKRFRGNVYHSLIAYNWGPTNLAIALKRGDPLPSGPVKYANQILAQQASWLGAVRKQAQVG